MCSQRNKHSHRSDLYGLLAISLELSTPPSPCDMEITATTITITTVFTSGTSFFGLKLNLASESDKEQDKQETNIASKITALGLLSNVVLGISKAIAGAVSFLNSKH